MKISEIKSGQGKIDVEAVITEMTPVKEINKFGRQIKVSTATIKDDSGKMKLSLWNEDTGRIGLGDKIKVTNGYASEFKGEMQLTAGKFGKLEVLEKGTGEIQEEIRTNVPPQSAQPEGSAEISVDEDEEW